MPERYIWRGSTSSEVNSGVIDGRSLLRVLTITNRRSGPVTINLIVKTTNEGQLYIAPQNLTLEAGTSYREWNINLEDRDELIIQASGKVDFYCSFGTPEITDINR